MMDEQAVVVAIKPTITDSTRATGERFATRTLGEVGVWRGALPRHPQLRAANACVLCLPATGLRWSGADDTITCAPGQALLIDPAVDADALADVRGYGLVLLLPRRLAAMWLHGRGAVSVVASANGFEAIVRLVDGLSAPDVCLSPPQARLGGRAICEWLAAVIAPRSNARTAIAERREASLLDRLADHIDGHLADQLDAATLCAALSCSRSVLYRATAPVGGVSAFVTQRRLAAVFACLTDPTERGTVAALARACGFHDATGFGRIFKRHFGGTAIEFRRRGALPHDPES